MRGVSAHDIPDSATVKASDDLLVSEFGTELVILNLKDGVYFGLEDVGVRIWKLLQEPTTVPAIRDVLVSEYDVDTCRCENDVRSLLAVLVAQGLVEIRTEA
jgi:hypothetical protein